MTRVKENADKEINELKLQLKMVEESRDAVRRDLIEAQRKIRHGEEAMETARKEIAELRRALKDEEKEKEAIQLTTNELRGKVKRAEGESLVFLLFPECFVTLSGRCLLNQCLLNKYIASSFRRIYCLQGEDTRLYQNDFHR